MSSRDFSDTYEINSYLPSIVDFPFKSIEEVKAVLATRKDYSLMRLEGMILLTNFRLDDLLSSRQRLFIVHDLSLAIMRIFFTHKQMAHIEEEVEEDE